MAHLIFLLATLLWTAAARGAAVVEPPDGKVFVGAWLNLSDDTPAAFNTRMGFNASAFQFAQDIPLTAYNYTSGAGGEVDISFLDATETNASIFLTVYPSTTLDLIATTDLTALGNQILTYQSTPFNYSVFLRYAPEMQGNWNVYGVAPTSYVSGWKTMYTTIKAIAPETQIVWSPNSGYSYPYGYTFSSLNLSTTDETALDTNGDGTYDDGDDAYSPYYPGDAYVDWAGLSYYEKGSTYPYVNNVPQANGTFYEVLMGNNTETVTPFYPTYCASRACCISEGGAAWHINNDTQPSDAVDQLNLQQLFWKNTWTNASVYTTFPNLKMFFMFEFEKEEEGDLRDYRITYNSTLRSAFLSDIQTLIPDVYLESIYRSNSSIANSSVASSIVSSLAAATATSTSTTVSNIITNTVRHGYRTGTPSLFGGATRVLDLQGFFDGAFGLGCCIIAGVIGALTVL